MLSVYDVAATIEICLNHLIHNLQSSVALLKLVPIMPYYIAIAMYIDKELLTKALTISTCSYSEEFIQIFNVHGHYLATVYGL